MINKEQFLGPVAIGGVGGSGTRIVAQIMINLGYYMGCDLNPAYDNLWFTFLFTRPKWFANYANDNERAICSGFTIFEKAMKGITHLNASELRFVAIAALEAEHIRISRRKHRRMLWSLKRGWKLSRMRQLDYSSYIGWGWKEPNTHIYIGHLSKKFTSAKYIHVLRHGLDMAFSKNKNQLFNWAHFFEINIAGSNVSLPNAALKYWIKANRRAFTLGEQLGPERFLQVKFEDLCVSPKIEIEKIISFLGLRAATVDLDSLYNIPSKPKSMERYKNHDLTIFNQADLEAVRELGFMIEK